MAELYSFANHQNLFMGLIKEPLELDFTVNPRPLTKKEQLAISEFIKMDKAKRVSIERNTLKTKITKKDKVTV